MSGQELSLIHQAFDSNYIAPLGPMVDAFEREFADYTGIPYCLALSSGTAAMHLAMRELGVGPGDEVLASSLTFMGSVSSAIHLGASAAFIDSDVSTWNMDPDLLADELDACDKRGKLPKAVIPTDIYGQCADLERIRAVCQSYGIPVVVDAAESTGAFYEDHRRWATDDEPGIPDCGLGATGPAIMRHAGYGGKACISSFNGNKIITTSGGGMLASHDKEFIAHARKLSQQAREPMPFYQHNEVGYNYRLSNVLAAIGRGQLQVLPSRVQAKRRIFDSYRELLGDLPGFEFMPEAEYGCGNRWLTVVLIDPQQFGATNEEVRVALEAENIESRPVWKPMHLQPVFHGARVRGGEVSEHLFNHGLCLPSGTAMTESDIERVAQVISSCCRPALVSRFSQELVGRW
jgi:dTDP-4-amino-4,6-dideoxygalactose transaminase